MDHWTLDAITASLENHVFPVLGRRPIADLQPRDVRDVVKAVEDTGAAETAGRVFQRPRSILRYAIANDLASVDATYPLKPSDFLRPREIRHRASFTEQQMPDFFRRLAAYQGGPSTMLALRLLLLTAVRPGELRNARWNEFDAEAGLWRIPAVRMKMKREHLVPISKQALIVINELADSSLDRECVFPSPFYPGKPISDGTLNSALARLGYKGAATAHGFRTLFSTCGNEAGLNSDVIERQLAHEERNTVRAAYNRAQRLDERRRLMQWWADRIDHWRAKNGFV